MKTYCTKANRRALSFPHSRNGLDPLERRLLLATITVNSAADSNAFDDQLTLREAILIANGQFNRGYHDGEKNAVSGATFVPVIGGWQLLAGTGAGVADQINFGNITSINPDSQLPDMGKNDRMNGAMPAGGRVILSGQNAGQATGLVLRGFNGPSSNEVRNMEIRNFFYDGIYGEGIKGGIFAGLDVHNNGQEGILLTTLTTGGQTFNTRDTRIGGGGGDRNTIHGNGRHGVSIFAALSSDRPLLNNLIENNYIGLDSGGASDRGNGQNGVHLSQAHGNTIRNNVISGNNNDGMQINGAKAHSNVMTGNIIGLDPGRTLVIGNSASGVALIDAGAYFDEFGQANQIGQTNNGNTIAGNGFAGVFMSGANAAGNSVLFNAIGFGPGKGNGGPGVTMYGGANNNIVGGGEFDRNFIQNNGGPGVDIANAGSTGNVIRNNFIGNTGGAGQAQPNADGVRIFGGAANNVIFANIISGNTFTGVGIYNPGSTGNRIDGNFIGTERFGSIPLPNGGIGVVIQEGAGGNFVTGNRIAGNVQDGVLLQHPETTGNVISGNLIGLFSDRVVGNGGHGVRINGALNTRIGGTNAADANSIRFNTQDGVYVQAGTGNQILGNSITSNGGLGIDLGPDGATPNDSLDADTGANNLQNTPVLTAVIPRSSTTGFFGGLHSRPNTQYTVEFFSNAAGQNEGETWRTRLSPVTTDASGNATFALDFAFVLPVGVDVTATATDPAGNTSEFSVPFRTVSAQSTFPGVHPIPGKIQAEEFDEGGESLAYHDTTFLNDGGQYRQTGVDIESTTDLDAGYNVGFVKAGEWLEYTVNVASFALYDLAVRVANTAANGRFHVEFNGANVTGNVTVPSTGGFQTWTTIHVPVTLADGQQVMRAAFDVEGDNTWVGNVNWFQFTLRPLVTSLTAAPNPAFVGDPVILTAEANDPDGTVGKIDFYRESNGTAGLQIGSDTLVGSDNTPSGGWLAIGSTAGFTPGTYTYYAVATDNLGAVGPAFSTTQVVQEPPPPAVTGTTFRWESGPHQLQVIFSQDVGTSLGSDDIFVRNLTTGNLVPAANLSLNYSSIFKTATITITGYPRGILPDGNYSLTLAAEGISNAGGKKLDGDNNGTAGGDYVYTFFQLTGDANHDRKVDFNDLALLAQNYNTTGKNFPQGNFDYDVGGKVDFNDLALLAQRYNASLPPVPAGTVAVAAQLPEGSTDERRRTADAVFNSTVPVQRKKPAKPSARRH